MAAATDTTTAPSDHRRRGWAYRGDGLRDRRLDLLRGYALAAMSVNHFGLHQSYLHSVSGRSSFLISAAEAFLFISGFTLGVVSIGRSPEAVTARLRHRTWIVYLATIGITLGFAIVALTTHLQLWGELDAGSFASVWDWLAGVVTLRTTFNGADILVAYVLYLAAGIGALRLMTTGRSWVVAAVVAGLYVLSQLAEPEATSLGFASFRALIPNAPLFFGGLLIGYHREAIGRWWNRVPGRRGLDVVLVGLAIVMGWLHARGDLTADLGEREFVMPADALVVVGLYLRALWIVVDRCWVPLRRALGWLLLPLGEASLFTFTMHLVAIPLVVNLPGFPGEDVGRWAATAWVLLHLGVIHLAVLARREVLDWLRSGGGQRAWVRRNGPVVAVGALLVGVLLVSSSTAGAAGEWAGPEREVEEGLDEDDERLDALGELVDRVADGELEPAQALELVPGELTAEVRAEIERLLGSDPFAAEELLVEVVLGD